MTTAKQVAANRKNATRSTGPKTAIGKRNASQNALKHGLAVPLDHAENEALSKLANGIRVRTSLNQAAALIAAHEQLQLARVRQVRLDLIRQVEADSTDAISRLAATARYEKRAMSAQRRLFQWENKPKLK